MLAETAAVLSFFVLWLSPHVGLSFQNGYLQAELTESLSPNVSTYPSVSTPGREAEPQYWAASDLLQMKSEDEPKLALVCNVTCLHWQDTTFQLPLWRQLIYMIRFYGSAAHKHRLARSTLDLWAMKTQLPCEYIRNRCFLLLSICLPGKPCRNSVNSTYLNKVH